MARQKNDGKGRLGGRSAGTPNKSNAQVKEWIGNLLAKSRTQIEKDLQAMEPQERVKLLFSLVGYVVPKQQAVTIEEQAKIEAEALTQWLQTAPAEAIDGIAAKVMELQQIKQQEYEN